MLISTIVVFGSVAYSAQVDLIWDPPDIEPAGYKVYYGTASAHYTKSVDVGKATTCTITGLEEGNTYYFAASAYYANEPESGFSNEISQYFPKHDADGDGLPDIDEINITGTDPNKADTDDDGIHDGEEFNFWGDDWDVDLDGDGRINLLDPDSDGDGNTDGSEINGGYDPSDPRSLLRPPVLFLIE